MPDSKPDHSEPFEATASIKKSEVREQLERIPGKILPFLGSQAVRRTLRIIDRREERRMPG